ncbi:hypothetical protein P9112_008151 [Eukaryota sp. TZLM1-RC]
MKHVAAYLLAVLGGNRDPSVEDVTGIIASIGGSADPDATAKLVSELKGKDIEEVLAEGRTKLASVPSAAPAGTAAVTAAEAAPVEEEKVEEEEVEEDIGGFDLFGDDDDW